MPTPEQVHVDVALTNVSVAYKNPAFIADQLAPAIPVRKQSNKYFIYDPSREAFRPGNDLRAPGAEASEIDFTLSTDSYYCEDHALESTIPDEERENADSPLQPDIDRIEFLTDKVELNREVALSSLLSATAGLPGATLSGADQWSDYSGSDPVLAVEEQKVAIQSAVQQVPNTLVLPYQVYQKVRNHPKVIEKVQNVRLGVVTSDVLAQIFDVEQVLVPRALKNIANPGQLANLDYVWGKNAYLCYVAPRPGLKCVSLTYSFVWNGAQGAVDGRLVETWRENRRKADMVRVQKYYDLKLIATGAMYRWLAAIA